MGCFARLFVVKDAAPTKALPGSALRYVRDNGGDGRTERPLDGVEQEQVREQSRAAIEAEQRDRLKKQFGAHDGL